jgi:hypothetical protein
VIAVDYDVLRQSEKKLHPVILILGCIAWTGLEEIVIRLDIFLQVDNFSGSQLPDGI